MLSRDMTVLLMICRWRLASIDSFALWRDAYLQRNRVSRLILA